MPEFQAGDLVVYRYGTHQSHTFLSPEWVRRLGRRAVVLKDFTVANGLHVTVRFLDETTPAYPCHTSLSLYTPDFENPLWEI